MTVFYAKLLKLSVVVATSAINTNLFDHKVVCCDPIEPLLSVRDSIVKFDVNIAIKRYCRRRSGGDDEEVPPEHLVDPRWHVDRWRETM